MHLVILTENEALGPDHEPRKEAVIAFEIPGVHAWEKRTYRAVRAFADTASFRVELGEAHYGSSLFASWASVCQWFRSLRPRNVEVLYG